MQSRDGCCLDVSMRQDPLGLSEMTLLGFGFSGRALVNSGHEDLDSVSIFVGSGCGDEK